MKHPFLFFERKTAVIPIPLPYVLQQIRPLMVFLEKESTVHIFSSTWLQVCGCEQRVPPRIDDYNNSYPESGNLLKWRVSIRISGCIRKTWMPALEESIFNDSTPEVSFQEDSVRQRSNDENVRDEMRNRTIERRIEITPNTEILHQPTERDNSIPDREIVHSSENNDVIRPVGEPVIATTTQETPHRRSTRTRNQTKFYGID